MVNTRFSKTLTLHEYYNEYNPQSHSIFSVDHRNDILLKNRQAFCKNLDEFRSN